MAIHSQQKDHLRRRRESLGHLKLHLDDLAELVDEWERWCSSVTISVGDGVTADVVEDLVDATNFVLLELGQPMHVFDCDKIGGSLIEIKSIE